MSKPLRYLKRKSAELLSTDLFGRPSRKILWTILRVLRFMLNGVTRFYHFSPYILELKKRLNPKDLLIVANYYQHLSCVTQSMPLKPKISILVPVYKVNYDYFRECLQSVAIQAYENWELCIVDDASNDSEIIKIIVEFEKLYPGKVRWSQHKENKHISATSNSCLELATGDYLALLDHDDRLYPNSLAEIVRYINLNESSDILYSDERTVTQAGERLNVPYHKPGWSPWMHLSVNYTTHLSVYRTELIRKIGGFRLGFEGAQDHDLMLRAVETSKMEVVHVPMCLYQWRAHANSTAQSISSKPYAAVAGEKAVREALQRRGIAAEVTYEPKTVHYRVKPKIVAELAPLISIIIPSKDSTGILKTCLTSVFEKSTYQNFEVIISDNGSSSEECKTYYEEMLERYPSRFFVERNEGPFNFARQCNLGAGKAKGAFLLFLNNDTEVISPDWIEELLSFAQLKEIGAVGCKLLYSDNTIQHAGVLCASRKTAVHAGIELDRDDAVYSNILNTVHEAMAVTAACMMIESKKFFDVHEFDEHYLPNAYGDIEFCLRLREAGLTCLFTPYAELYHFESKSRGKGIEHFERQFLMRRFGAWMLNDPYLNPNLLRGSHYEIDLSYIELDINRAQFHYFLNTPKSDWVAKLKTMRNKGKPLQLSERL